MKTLKYILWAFLAAFAAVGCSDDPTYTAGSEEDPDNYGVYFPTQTSPTEVEPGSRGRARDHLQGPPHPVSRRHHGSGRDHDQRGGDFRNRTDRLRSGRGGDRIHRLLPQRQGGRDLPCDIRIVDPHYISIYGPRATSLSFSVLRAGWEPGDRRGSDQRQMARRGDRRHLLDGRLDVQPLPRSRGRNLPAHGPSGLLPREGL